ncbi:MAG: hypothetical protein RIE06_29265 [Roseibium album]|nr:hypothetical protein [Labrenzia sp. EL_195]MBG6172460.1 hypothetical protein [Labrenzia sp. EL_132]MBG6205274.1 hypothetical protein [Labrenzia sp. EL_13]MBG6227322.1 hypothetical protein [Labrenzia sp. EL_208]
MTEVVVLMSALLFSDLQKSDPSESTGSVLAAKSRDFNARSNIDLATPNSDASGSFFVTFILDERAGEFAESVKSIDGVLSVDVKPELGLP